MRHAKTARLVRFVTGNHVFRLIIAALQIGRGLRSDKAMGGGTLGAIDLANDRLARWMLTPDSRRLYDVGRLTLLIDRMGPAEGRRHRTTAQNAFRFRDGEFIKAQPHQRPCPWESHENRLEISGTTEP
jgi:hypothetical protein